MRVLDEIAAEGRAWIGTGWRSALGWLTLDGRLLPAHPWSIAGLAGVAVLALLFPSRWLLYIVYVAALLVLAAYLWVRAIGPRLSLTRQLAAPWAEVGDELEERWALTNSAPLPLHWLELDDDSTLPGYNARRVVSCEAGRSTSWQTLARCERRGVYRLGPLTARMADPLGIFRFVWREGAVRQLIVYPPLVRLPALPLPRGERGGLAQADLLQLHATPSVGGLRDYTPGDQLSRIHWPYVARLGRLVVKEFDQERAGALWLLLDLAAGAYPESRPAAAAPEPAADGALQSSVMSERPTEIRPATLVELAVTLTASLAAQVLSEGRTVGLICDDGRRRLVPPGSGPRQLWQILNELVDSGATGGQSLAAMLRQGWGQRGERGRGAVVLVTGDLAGSWPSALAAGWRPGSATALLVAADAAQAAPCAAMLGAQGVQVRAFALGTPLPLLNPPRRRVTARVTPMGRVVREAG